MVTMLALQKLASQVFGCAPTAVHVENGIEQHDGKTVNFCEVYHLGARPGRASRGSRTDERIARMPFVSSFYDGQKEVMVGQNRAEQALADLLERELAMGKRGDAPRTTSSVDAAPVEDVRTELATPTTESTTRG